MWIQPPWKPTFGSPLPRGDHLDENPACWTDGFSFQKCCVGDGVAAGCWATDDSDQPHSRQRCCESPCGARLRARIAAEGHRRCGGRRPWNITLVAGLWNLRRDTWASHVRYKEGAERGYDRYLSWLDVLLQKRQALVLFLDSEAAAFAARRRWEYNLTSLTCVVEVAREELPQYRWHSKYLAAHEENMRLLPNETTPEVVRADYTLVVNSKPELLACAALWNPFRSDSFAWVDAGAGRKRGFPHGPEPIKPPICERWALCVGRRMWLFFDFRSKLKRLEHGSTFDTTVLLGGFEGVLLYALWFQWSIARYLDENIMDDEQSIIAEVWWSGHMNIRSYFGMGWTEGLRQLLPAATDGRGSRLRQSRLDSRTGSDGPALPGRSNSPAPSTLEPDESEAVYKNIGETMGRWFGASPHLIWRNDGRIWIPSAVNLMVVIQTPVNQITDDDLERVAYALWCLHGQYDYYRSFCDAYKDRVPQFEVEGSENFPVVSRGMRLVPQGAEQ